MTRGGGRMDCQMLGYQMDDRGRRRRRMVGKRCMLTGTAGTSEGKGRYRKDLRVKDIYEEEFL